MPAGTTPLFVQNPNIGWSNAIILASTSKDGSGVTFDQPLFVGNTQNGSFVDYIRVRSLGTNTQSAGRIFLNNGAIGGTAQSNNNMLLTEINLPSVTWSESAALPELTSYLKMAIPAGYNLYATVANTINAGAGWEFTAVGGDYGLIPGGGVPIFLRAPRLYFSNTLLTQNQTRYANSGTITQVFAANTLNGSYLDHIRAKPIGTNVVTVVRVFINNGQSTTLQNNNVLFTELSLPAITLNEAQAQPDVPIAIKAPLKPGYNVYVTLGTTVAAGWTFTGGGGDY